MRFQKYTDCFVASCLCVLIENGVMVRINFNNTNNNTNNENSDNNKQIYDGELLAPYLFVLIDFDLCSDCFWALLKIRDCDTAAGGK